MPWFDTRAAPVHKVLHATLLSQLLCCAMQICKLHAAKGGELKQYADKAWQSVMKGFEAPKCPNKVTAVMMGQHSRLHCREHFCMA